MLFNTIKYLRIKQIRFRIFYGIRNRFFNINYDKLITSEVTPLKWENSFYSPTSYTGENLFSFLNIEYLFEGKINWNVTDLGKLWTYNLNYFDFLNQEHIKTEEGLNLINDYIKNDLCLKDGKESYPISLRGINWIKFLSSNNIKIKRINQVLYNHYQILVENIEYHLLGNHLLENGFSLFFGALYFKDEILYAKAKKILTIELEEQILDDGAHFELSPMYHQIILHRLLDCIKLAELNTWKQDILLPLFKETASKMLSWLEAITFEVGAIPMVNDSTYDIAPSSRQLFECAKQIGIQWNSIKLSDSGYRKFKLNAYELFVDVGNVGPTYQPGHAHSDMLSFVLYHQRNPVIVDRGISTYEKNERRFEERKTASHNTVEIGHLDQSEVWGGFRVARRAKPIIIEESKSRLKASHTGYDNLGARHIREWVKHGNNIQIVDKIEGEIKEGVAYIHLHPNVKIDQIGDSAFRLNNIVLHFENHESLSLEKYEFCLGFNKTKSAYRFKINFKEILKTKIKE